MKEYIFDSGPNGAQNRPLQLWEPCFCGCDQRGDPDLVGYLHGVANGKGFTVPIHDKAVWDRIREVAQAQGIRIG